MLHCFFGTDSQTIVGRLVCLSTVAYTGAVHSIGLCKLLCLSFCVFITLVIKCQILAFQDFESYRYPLYDKKNTRCFRWYRILKKGQQILAFQARQISVVLIKNTDIFHELQNSEKGQQQLPCSDDCFDFMGNKK